MYSYSTAAITLLLFVDYTLTAYHNTHNAHYSHSYHPKVAPYPVKAYQTYYPSSPSHHYTNQPTHHYCNIPPDLWCDSPQSAQQCGVQRQCDALRFHKRRPIKITLIYEALCPYCQKFISNQLGSMYQQYKDHLELELVPWGNSRILREKRILSEFEALRKKLEQEAADEIHAQQERLARLAREQEEQSAKERAEERHPTLQVKWMPTSDSDYNEESLRKIYETYGTILTITPIRTTKKGARLCVVEFDASLVEMGAELEVGKDGPEISGAFLAHAFSSSSEKTDMPLDNKPFAVEDIWPMILPSGC
ncbi:hypothetical protein Y032_0139g2100 [Ancylostoma ceylanicum]|uniref:RRM domain-containing protein n=1 Tax=Ancylostoma ceylanicum TaxID=53326 RepID=A0A016T4D3_9BILA|nr:hypothetical protein Y032_0139g2100 [Ancylostoma ceylanicum]